MRAAIAHTRHSRLLHVSAAPRAEIIQDLYAQRVKSYKPQPITPTADELAQLKWTPIAHPQVPTDEIQAKDIDAYAGQKVEVESAAPTETEAATDGDWFPIEEEK